MLGVSLMTDLVMTLFQASNRAYRILARLQRNLASGLAVIGTIDEALQHDSLDSMETKRFPNPHAG